MMRFLAVLMVTLLLPVTVAAQEACAVDRLDIRSDKTAARFRVEVADTVESRATGLMNRPQLGRFDGMIFVYDKPQPVNFWMRNTLIPLDMVFINANGIVERVHENAVPLDETPIFGGSNIKYVLEINGGMAKALQIEPGAEVRHPAITGADVVWKCN